tara:strand:+ start:210 stop:377 length:168 start_codon:yes stop_codon:yes gene_type:complete
VFETMMKQFTQLGTRNDRHTTERKRRSKKVGEKSRKAKNVKGDKNSQKGRMNFFG